MASIAAQNKKDMDDLTKLFQQTKINEAEEYIKKRKVAVMNFGRLNPPTRGHYKLLEYIADQAKLLGGKGFIFLSASQNYLPPHKGTKWRPVVNRVTKSTFRSNKSNENPLSVWDKMNILYKFPEIENLEYINPQGEKGRPYTMDRAAVFLRNRGYTDIYLVVGTDRFKQLKDKGVESTWNLTLIEHPRSERLDDLTLYSIDKTIPKKSLAINPEAISGTKSRAAAAEHAINGINGIDSMTLRQAEEAIMNRRNPMHQSHGFITFKEYMPNILTDSQLELIIYKIKKGMLLRPSQSYTNNHKRNRMVRRSSMTKKKGGKRRRRTRRKRGSNGKKTKKGIAETDGKGLPESPYIQIDKPPPRFIMTKKKGGKRRKKTRKKRGGTENLCKLYKTNSERTTKDRADKYCKRFDTNIPKNDRNLCQESSGDCWLPPEDENIGTGTLVASRDRNLQVDDNLGFSSTEGGKRRKKKTRKKRGGVQINELQNGASYIMAIPYNIIRNFGQLCYAKAYLEDFDEENAFIYHTVEYNGTADNYHYFIISGGQNKGKIIFLEDNQVDWYIYNWGDPDGPTFAEFSREWEKQENWAEFDTQRCNWQRIRKKEELDKEWQDIVSKARQNNWCSSCNILGGGKRRNKRGGGKRRRRTRRKKKTRKKRKRKGRKSKRRR